MGIFRRKTTIGRSSLSQEDIDRLIDLYDPYRTDYSYVTSKSYRRDGSNVYENPRMFRFPMGYYKRKWALEDAWNRGVLVFLAYYIMDFCGRIMENPSSVIGAIFRAVYFFFYGLLVRQKRHREDLSSSFDERSSLSGLSESAAASEEEQQFFAHETQQIRRLSWWQKVTRFLYRITRTVIYISTLGYFPRGYRNEAYYHQRSLSTPVYQNGQHWRTHDYSRDDSTKLSSASFFSRRPNAVLRNTSTPKVQTTDTEGADFHTYHLRDRVIHVAPESAIEPPEDSVGLEYLKGLQETSLESTAYFPKGRYVEEAAQGGCGKLWLFLLLLLLGGLLAGWMFGGSEDGLSKLRAVEVPAVLFGNFSNVTETVRDGGKWLVAATRENAALLWRNVRLGLRGIWRWLLRLFHYRHPVVPFPTEDKRRCEKPRVADVGRDDSEAQQAEEGSVDFYRLLSEKESWADQLSELRRERELTQDQYEQLRKAIDLAQTMFVTPTPATEERVVRPAIVDEELLQRRIEQSILDRLVSDKGGRIDVESRQALNAYLKTRIDEIYADLEIRIESRMKEAAREYQESRDTLANEISELGGDVASAHNKLELMKQERDLKLAELTHSMIDRDTQQREDFKFMMGTEIQKSALEIIVKELEQRFGALWETKETSLREKLIAELRVIVLDLFSEHEGKMRGKEEHAAVHRTELSVTDLLTIKRLITEALRRYDADKTGKIDYALESSGASVLSTRCTEAYSHKSRVESLFGFPLWYSSYSPRQVIQHRGSFASGECWAFKGVGYLVVKLAYPVYVTEISYEHLPSCLHPDGNTKSAPQRFQIFSLRELDALDSQFLIGEYEYDNKGETLQTFVAQNIPHDPTPIIELKVLSNWGAPYTCLYRLRIHGRHPSEGVMEPPPEVDHPSHEEAVKKTEPIHFTGA